MKLRLTMTANEGHHFAQGRAAKLELDGVDVSQYVSRVVLTVDANEVVAAEVTYYPTEVEVDVEALVSKVEEP